MKQLFAWTTVFAVVALSSLSAANARWEVARGGGRGGEEHGNFNRGGQNYHRDNSLNHPAAVGYGAGQRRGYNEGYEQGANSSYQSSDQVYYDPEQQQMDQEYNQETQNIQQPNYRSYRNS